MLKLYKLVDLAGQAAITVICILLAIIKSMGEALLWWYFILGSWQLCSFFIHFSPGAGWKNSLARKYYGRMLAWTAGIGLFSFLLALIADPVVFLIYLILLLFISPVMAIWYFVIVFDEWNIIRQRERIHMK